MKKIYLHIGTPKTGTTALQTFFYSNVSVMEAAGLYYPTTKSEPNREFGGSTAGNIGWIIGKYVGMRDYRGMALEFSQLMGNHEVMLLSSEWVWAFITEQREFFQALKDAGFDVEVVVYLRPQEEYLESMYREEVKNLICLYEDFSTCINPDTLSRNDLPLEHLNSIERLQRTARYYSTLKDIAAALGKEKVHIRIYQREQLKNGNIIEDFFDTIDYSLDGESIYGSKYINPTLDFSLLEIKRKINLALEENDGKKPVKMLFNTAVMKVLLNKGKKDSHFASCITQEERQKLRLLYAGENEKIAREFLNRKDGKLFYQQKEPAASEQVAVTQQELLDDFIQVYVTTTVRQQREISCLWKEINEMKEKMRASDENPTKQKDRNGNPRSSKAMFFFRNKGLKDAWKYIKKRTRKSL